MAACIIVTLIFVFIACSKKNLVWDDLVKINLQHEKCTSIKMNFEQYWDVHIYDSYADGDVIISDTILLYKNLKRRIDLILYSFNAAHVKFLLGELLFFILREGESAN